MPRKKKETEDLYNNKIMVLLKKDMADRIKKEAEENDRGMAYIIRKYLESAMKM